MALKPTTTGGREGFNPREVVSARNRVLVSAAAGLVVGVVSAFVWSWRLAPMAGWSIAALVFLIWTWGTLWHLDAAQTAAHALREDPSRGVFDVILLTASVVSLLTVALVLFQPSADVGVSRPLRIGLGIVSVVISWALVHSVYTLRYAELYYDGVKGGVNFNQDADPCYSDFAYLAFTLGMTYQVSDTALNDTQVRRTALRQGLLGYLFGTVIIAVTINLVAGLSK